jgi:hypothetical protein
MTQERHSQERKGGAKAPALTWALVLAVLFAPIHSRIEAFVRRPKLAALVSVLLVAITIVVPVTFVAQRLVTEAANGATLVQAELETGSWRQILTLRPQLAPIDKWLERQFDLPAIFGNVAAWLTAAAASFVRGTVVQLLGVLLTFYLLFYFLRDRVVAVKTLRGLLPLSRSRAFAAVRDGGAHPRAHGGHDYAHAPRHLAQPVIGGPTVTPLRRSPGTVSATRRGPAFASSRSDGERKDRALPIDDRPYRPPLRESRSRDGK